jgi:hypothetical protein
MTSRIAVIQRSQGVLVGTHGESASFSSEHGTLGVRLSAHVMKSFACCADQVLVGGASGLIGKNLMAALSVPSMANGFNPEICSLVRRQPRNKQYVRVEGCCLVSFGSLHHLQRDMVGSVRGSNRNRENGGV